MASKSALMSFQQSWNQTAAWAQSKGIKRNDYYPIYQEDAARLIQYGSPMSEAERERAVLAAANISTPTQATPSTTPNPGNILGNTLNDLRGIFTGIGDIAIHPLHNGFTDAFKNTFDLIDGSHQLQGATGAEKIGDLFDSTVLSFVPGLSDVGTVLQAGGGAKGLEQLAEHPVSALLDVLPIAKPLAFVDPEASIVSRIGHAGEDAKTIRKLGVGDVLKGYVRNTETGKTGLLDSGMGGVGKMTVGDRIDALMGRSMFGTNKSIADLMQAAHFTINHYTTEERVIFTQVDEITKNFTGEQWEQLHDAMDPSDPVKAEKVMSSPDTDPQVKAAARAIKEGPQRFQREESLAVDGLIKIRTPKLDPETKKPIVDAQGNVQYQEGLFSVTDKPAVKAARDALRKTYTQLLGDENLPMLEKAQELLLKNEQKGAQTVDALEKAQLAARQVDVEGQIHVDLPGAKRSAPLSRARAAKSLFGQGGFIDELLDLAKAKEWDTVQDKAKAAIRRMQRDGPRGIKVDGESPKEFQAVLQQVQILKRTADTAIQVEKKLDKDIYGAKVAWDGSTKARDELHAAHQQVLKVQQREQLKELRNTRNTRLQRVRQVVAQRKANIRSKYAADRVATNAQLKADLDGIRQQADLSKRKAYGQMLRDRAAHQEWVKGHLRQFPDRRAEAAAGALKLPAGAPGTREWLAKEEQAIEVIRSKAADEALARYPSKDAQRFAMERELRKADKIQSDFEKRITRTKTDAELRLKRKGGEWEKQEKALAKEHKGKLKRDGKVSEAFKAYTKANKAFGKAVWDHPSDNNVDLFFRLFAKNLLAHEDGVRVREKIISRAEEKGAAPDVITELRQNDAVMARLVQQAIEGTYTEPLSMEDIDPKFMESARDSAMKELHRLNLEGHHPEYIPHVSTSQLAADETGTYGVHLWVGKGVPKPDVFSGRVWDYGTSRYDIMAGFHRGVKQALDRDAVIDYMSTYLEPKTVTKLQLQASLEEFHRDEIAGLHGQALDDYISAKAKEMGLVVFDPTSIHGFSTPKYDAGDVYLDKNLADAVEKLTNGGHLPTHGVVQQGTKLFRYSILGLSPRYTAHIVFGGTFLLALRSTPYMPSMLFKAVKALKTGDYHEDLLATATNMGTTDFELRKLGYPEARDLLGRKMGEQITHLMGQEHIERIQGVKLAAAKPLHWVKALADLNLRFTSYVVNLQKTVAYLDGAAAAVRHDVLDEHGDPIEMSQSRMAAEGMHHAEQVMGDLRRMSPFEQQVARSVVPFYGWTKHILQYVLSFPHDHPWRAMMLANMAEYDQTHNPGGLPSRFQFLFSFGGADAQGNVTAFDFRAVNPLRDVANYATLGGVIGSLNPLITAAAAEVDPSIMYGENQLYPNVTYDQFYGIETAPAQGSPLTAAEQVVPELGALQSAFDVVNARQGMSTKALVKNIFESLNIPMVQPQQINLKQEAAKTALAEYQVTKTLATNAWQTGDFSQIADLGTVPDPRNPDYQTSVATLQATYDQLKKLYPGQNPADVATPLPTLHL